MPVTIAGSAWLRRVKEKGGGRIWREWNMEMKERFTPFSLLDRKPGFPRIWFSEGGD